MSRNRKYTKEVLEKVVKKSRSCAEVLRRFNVKPSGGMHRHIKALIKYFQIDNSHFTGRAWNKGLSVNTSESVRKLTSRISRPDSEIFVRNSPPIDSVNLRKRLIKLGWKYRCKLCKINKWRGRLLRLHIDHKNGIHNDNRLINLRFLCPNCHQQTKNWGCANR